MSDETRPINLVDLYQSFHRYNISWVLSLGGKDTPSELSSKPIPPRFELVGKALGVTEEQLLAFDPRIASIKAFVSKE
jgi:hypothetical protein